MARKTIGATVVAAIAVLVAGAAARAEHVTDPRCADPVVVRICNSVESENGDRYHPNASGTGGQTCSAADANADPDADDTDHAGECFNRREQLKDKDTGAGEGGDAICRRADPQNLGAVSWDGLFTDCGDPANASDTSRRVYTGVAVQSVGSGGVAAGGNTSGGCLHTLGQDDTQGNQIATTTNLLQTLGGAPHGGSDDETDVITCWSY